MAWDIQRSLEGQLEMAFSEPQSLRREFSVPISMKINSLLRASRVSQYAASASEADHADIRCRGQMPIAEA